MVRRRQRTGSNDEDAAIIISSLRPKGSAGAKGGSASQKTLTNKHEY